MFQLEIATYMPGKATAVQGVFKWHYTIFGPQYQNAKFLPVAHTMSEVGSSTKPWAWGEKGYVFVHKPNGHVIQQQTLVLKVARLAPSVAPEMDRMYTNGMGYAAYQTISYRLDDQPVAEYDKYFHMAVLNATVQNQKRIDFLERIGYYATYAARLFRSQNVRFGKTQVIFETDLLFSFNNNNDLSAVKQYMDYSAIKKTQGSQFEISLEPVERIINIWTGVALTQDGVNAGAPNAPDYLFAPGTYIPPTVAISGFDWNTPPVINDVKLVSHGWQFTESEEKCRYGVTDVESEMRKLRDVNHPVNGQGFTQTQRDYNSFKLANNLETEHPSTGMTVNANKSTTFSYIPHTANSTGMLQAIGGETNTSYPAVVPTQTWVTNRMTLVTSPIIQNQFEVSVPMKFLRKSLMLFIIPCPGKWERPVGPQSVGVDFFKYIDNGGRESELISEIEIQRNGNQVGPKYYDSQLYDEFWTIHAKGKSVVPGIAMLPLGPNVLTGVKTGGAATGADDFNLVVRFKQGVAPENQIFGTFGATLRVYIMEEQTWCGSGGVLNVYQGGDCAPKQVTC